MIKFIAPSVSFEQVALIMEGKNIIGSDISNTCSSLIILQLTLPKFPFSAARNLYLSLFSQTLTTHFLGEENKEKRGLKILNNKLLNSSLSCFINFLRFQPVAAKKALICGEFSPQR